MSTIIELSKCPCCGNVDGEELEPIAETDEFGNRRVRCQCCDLATQWVHPKEEYTAETLWNNRPIEDAQAARIVELEAALVKAMVRGDYSGDFLNEMSLSDEDQSAMLAAADSLYDDLELIVSTIPGYKEQYRKENDAAYARAEKAKNEDDTVELHCAICEKPLFGQSYVWDTDRGYCCTACIKALKSKTEKN